MGKFRNQNIRHQRKANRRSVPNDSDEVPTLVPAPQNPSSANQISNENNTTQTTQKRKPDVEDVESETKIDQHVAKKKKKVDPAIVNCRKRFVEELRQQTSSGKIK